MMTSAVPSARDSGTSRRGFFTSPAVKVMLFQASAENSEPTCATPKATRRPNPPAAAVTAGTNAAQKIRARRDRLRVLHGPRMREIGRERSRIASKEHSQNDERDHSQRLRRGEDVLNQFSQAQSARVQSRQKHNQQQRDQLLQGKADRIFGGEPDGRDDPGGRGNGRRKRRRGIARSATATAAMVPV